MNKYYIVKMLCDNGIYRPDTIVIGDVEIRSPKSDLKDEKKVIESAINDTKNSNISIEFSSRIGVIVKASSTEQAILYADAKFIEVLDILSDDIVMSDLKLSNIGYIKNLKNGDIIEISDTCINPSMSFINIDSEFKKIEFSQWIIQENTDLAKRYKRALHWSKHAKWESNVQIRILFNCFAVEALFKNECNFKKVTSIMSWFIGYPTGYLAQHVSDITQTISDKSGDSYSIWRNRINNSLEEIREFRNDSVHNGFRTIDFSYDTMLLNNQIMVFSCSRSQKAVKQALLNGISTLEEFESNLHSIFSENRDEIIRDTCNCILPALENKNFSYINKRIFY